MLVVALNDCHVYHSAGCTPTCNNTSRFPPGRGCNCSTINGTKSDELDTTMFTPCLVPEYKACKDLRDIRRNPGSLKVDPIRFVAFCCFVIDDIACPVPCIKVLRRSGLAFSQILATGDGSSSDGSVANRIPRSAHSYMPALEDVKYAHDCSSVLL